MSNQPFAWSLAAVAVLAVAPYFKPPVPAPAAGDEAALKALDETFVQAFNKKDMDATLACYADDAVLMDPGPALIFRGKEGDQEGPRRVLQGAAERAAQARRVALQDERRLRLRLHPVDDHDERSGREADGDEGPRDGRHGEARREVGPRHDHASVPLPPPTMTATTQPAKAPSRSSGAAVERTDPPARAGGSVFFRTRLGYCAPSESVQEFSVPVSTAARSRTRSFHAPLIAFP
jgi:ketosteroid isomerase-like protein